MLQRCHRYYVSNVHKLCSDLESSSYYNVIDVSYECSKTFKNLKKELFTVFRKKEQPVSSWLKVVNSSLSSCHNKTCLETIFHRHLRAKLPTLTTNLHLAIERLSVQMKKIQLQYYVCNLYRSIRAQIFPQLEHERNLELNDEIRRRFDSVDLIIQQFSDLIVLAEHIPKMSVIQMN